MIYKTGPGNNREILVDITLDDDVVDRQMKQTAEELSRTLNIPGFRRSRIPYRVVERFVGREHLLGQCHEKLAEPALRRFMADRGIENPEAMTLENIDIDPVMYRFRLSLEPYASLAPDYRAIRVEPGALEMDEEQRSRARDELLQASATREESAESVDWGDDVILDGRSVVLDEDMEETDEVILDESGWQISLDRDHPLSPPGLEEELLGLQSGGAKSFTLTYPDDGTSVHSGKTVKFDVSIDTVMRQTTPEWDREFLVRVMRPDGEATESFEELEAEFWTVREQQWTSNILNGEIEEAFERLEQNAVLEIGEATVNNQVQSAIETRMQGMRQYGVNSLEGYLRLTGQTEAEYRETMKVSVRQELVQRLLLWEFIREENLELPDHAADEVTQAVNETIARVRETQADATEEAIERFREVHTQNVTSERMHQFAVDALLRMVTDGVHALPSSSAPREDAADEEAAQSAAETEATEEASDA